MSQRWPRLALGRVHPLQNAGEPAFDAIRRPRETPLWKLEASLKCRSCRRGRFAPPVRMIKLTETREITPYKWGCTRMRRGSLRRQGQHGRVGPRADWEANRDELMEFWKSG